MIAFRNPPTSQQLQGITVRNRAQLRFELARMHRQSAEVFLFSGAHGTNIRRTSKTSRS